MDDRPRPCSGHHFPLPLEEVPPHLPTPDHRPGVIERAISRTGFRPKQKRALLISIVFTVVMMIVEVFAGWLTGSLMLISDGLHMFSHAISLGISFFAILIAERQTGHRFSFGLYRVEILAALINGIGLLIFSVWIIVEAVERIQNPTAVMGVEVTIVAAIGLVVNLVTVFILGKAGLEDLNTRSAFLHMLADTMSSVVVLIGGFVIIFTGWAVVDPLLSLVVAAVIIKWSWGLIKESSLILLERKPEHLQVDNIVGKLRDNFPEIKSIHDVHIWEISSQFICLTSHVVIEDIMLSDTEKLRDEVTDYLRCELGIGHAVLQFEV